MGQIDQQHLRVINDETATWVAQAKSILEQRGAIENAASIVVDSLRRSVVGIRQDAESGWRVIPLRHPDGELLGHVARYAHLPGLTNEESQILQRLITEVAAATSDVRSSFGVRRFFRGSKKREEGRAGADFVADFHQFGKTGGLEGLLARLSQLPPVISVDTADALADWVGLAPRLADLGIRPDVIAATSFLGLPAATKTIETAVAAEAKGRADALDAGTEVRRSETRALLIDMPVERLKEATRDRIRVSPLTDAGIDTVQAVLDSGGKLEHIPGIGPVTANRMRGAAQTLRQTTYDEMPARIDIKNRTRTVTNFLRALSTWDASRTTKGATDDLARMEMLGPLAQAMDGSVTHLAVFHVGSTWPSELMADASAVIRRAEVIASAPGAKLAADPWDDFLSRPADYFAMLAELGFITEDEQKTHGDLPEGIIEAIRRLELNTEHLSASLRGYQSFAARFALVQRKVVIGDEMGLGKTVEALAVLAHLRTKGAHHAIVVCPAAVVTNWVREVSSKSALRAHRVHGQGRETALRNWIRNGGVAVTTFETLAWLERDASVMPELSCVVVDEAHYIKNPDALRTLRTIRLIDVADCAILLTGTPLENRIDEFRNLVGYVRPDLIVDANELTPNRFRKLVAPAYLRRNQEDVLTELPDMVEVQEWLPMSATDAATYREAVGAGNFMAMRQAAMVAGGQSQKLQRLIELVEEAEENGRRVIVFSYFRSVLDQVVMSLPGKVFGPLTGSVPAPARQAMVDRFSDAGHGAVLVAQIVAGGVGLNIQAASVVVICEPQLKPTTEWQAIARARRMGQLESVQVHRLLSEEGVDQRITEILARKRELFEDFARESDTAASAPEAYDVSEAELAREVVAAERERLFATQSTKA